MAKNKFIWFFTFTRLLVKGDGLKSRYMSNDQKNPEFLLTAGWKFNLYHTSYLQILFQSHLSQHSVMILEDNVKLSWLSLMLSSGAGISALRNFIAPSPLLSSGFKLLMLGIVLIRCKCNHSKKQSANYFNKNTWCSAIMACESWSLGTPNIWSVYLRDISRMTDDLNTLRIWPWSWAVRITS